MTRIILLAFLLAASAFAQNSPSACGPKEARFDVTPDRSHSAPPKMEPGKATAVFIQDFGGQTPLGIHVVGRIGIDGSWVGANKDSSYLFVPLDPGEHHICVDLDLKMSGEIVEFSHFTAEADAIYYFRYRYIHGGLLSLERVDSDEADYQMAKFPLSISNPKK
jgi:hypothetical protein